MRNSIDAVFSMPDKSDFVAYSPPAHLKKWVPFIRVADFQRYPAGKIAETLSAQGVKASPDDVRSILAAYKGKRNNPPIADQLDRAAADIAALKARGLSEHRICFWLAINRGMAIHQCQLNTWARIRRACDAICVTM
jgi:hypothetical protein